MAGSRRVTIEFLGDDKSLSKTARSIDGTTNKLGDTFKKVGATAAKGLAVGVAAAGVALVAFGKSAVAEAEEARKVAAQTEAVIKSTGGAANVTAGQVADLAEKLSMKAGIDDELIQSGSNDLLTFKNIRNEVGKGNNIFDKATTTALDMSVALGQDMKSASILVGKALNDPIAGLSALQRVGVTFTEQQKKNIETLVEEGNTMKAQKIILRELNSEFGGSAEAQATAGDKARVAWGNFQEEIGAKLLPLMDRLAVFFVTVIVPALQRFSAWFEREGVPVIKEFARRAQEVLAVMVAWVRKNWPEISRTIREVLGNVVAIVRGWVQLVTTVWKKWGDDLFRILKPILKNIVDQIRAVMKIIRGVIDVVTGLIKGDWSQVWRGIKQIFGGIWDSMKGNLRTVLKVFRSLIDSAWDAVKNLFKNAWEGIKNIFDRAWEGIKNLGKNALDWLKNRFHDYISIYRTIFSNMWDAIKAVWGNIRDGIKAVWTNGIRPVFDALKSGVRAIPNAFRAAKEGIGRVWEGLKRIAAMPVNFVINQVYNNGIRKALNLIPGVDLGEASDINFWRGGYTGPGGKEDPAGIVHRDEFVIRKEARQALEQLRPGMLEYMNRVGAWPGYAGGGRVWPVQSTPTTYPGHDGVDLAVPYGTPIHAAAAGNISYVGWGRGYGLAVFEAGPYGELVYGHMARTAARTGERVGAGEVIGYVDSTGNSSGNHLHFGFPGGSYSQALAFLNGANVVGNGVGFAGNTIGSIPTGVFDTGFQVATAVPRFIGDMADVWGDITSMGDRGPWWNLMANAPEHAFGIAKDWGLDKLKSAGAWMRDQTTGFIGDASDKAEDVWDSINGIDVPGLAGGGIVKARRGGTLALLGEGGEDEAVVPLRRGRPGGEQVVHVHLHLDGKEIESSQVRLKRLNGGRLAYI